MGRMRGPLRGGGAEGGRSPKAPGRVVTPSSPLSVGPSVSGTLRLRGRPWVGASSRPVLQLVAVV